MMSSRLLLLAALAACLRSGRAQGDPLPPSLVGLVLNSPISSADNLQKLLNVESEAEDDEKLRSEIYSNGTHRRFSRSLGVQVAQQAMCKVRTEVMEVTRAMLDKRNANFLLWPPCLEVQRCSGCCNTRALQCVPVATDTRHLQMTKIQFINRQPVYEKVIIPVEDHVSCSCQSRPSAHAPRLQTTPPPQLRLHPKVTALKPQSKEELHRHDELKHNQRLNLEDKETQEVHWQSKHTFTHIQSYTQNQHTVTHTPAVAVYVNKGDIPARKTMLGSSHKMSDATQTEEVQERDVHQTQMGSGGDATKMTSTLKQNYDQNHNKNQQLQSQDKITPDQPLHNPAQVSVQSERSMPHSSQSDGLSRTYSHVEVIGQSSGVSEGVSQHSDQSEGNHHKVLHEQEVKQHQEMQHHLHHKHHHHTTQASRQHTSTQQTATGAPPTTPSSALTPPPPQPPRKQRRKNRRRISKTSMRAMIKVMP